MSGINQLLRFDCATPDCWEDFADPTYKYHSLTTRHQVFWLCARATFIQELAVRPTSQGWILSPGSIYSFMILSQLNVRMFKFTKSKSEMKKFESLEHRDGDSDVLTILQGSRGGGRRWEIVIFRHERAGLKISGPCMYGRSACMRSSLDDKAFLAVKTWGRTIRREYTVGRRAYSDFAWVVRGAYIYLLVFFSAIVLQSSSRSRQQAKVFLNTSSYFHALETVTFVSIFHIYVPIAPCSRANRFVASAST